MNSQKTLEILRSIVETRFGSAVMDDASLAGQIRAAGWSETLSAVLASELRLNVTPEEIESAASLRRLAELVESRFTRDLQGRSLVDIYAAVEQLVREELSHDINYHWHATWQGDLLNNTDSLEDVEIVIRIEQAFGFSIPDRDAQPLHTVAQTVLYLWQRICEQTLTLHERPIH